jgi:hypothetical protein
MSLITVELVLLLCQSQSVASIGTYMPAKLNPVVWIISWLKLRLPNNLVIFEGSAIGIIERRCTSAVKIVHLHVTTTGHTAIRLPW